jgi:uncharacterized protein (TIGR03492 family)
MKLLCLSNGHGEDVIAVRILAEIQKQAPQAEMMALPIVGEGKAYQSRSIPIWGKVQTMPSGGFVNMDSQQLWRDVQGGLIQLTGAQWQAVQSWAKTGGRILAVGDLVPLLFAWQSGANYAFVGTAKSEYYLRHPDGSLLAGHNIESRLGGVYLPWERWLLSRPNCQAVFPRDRITTEVLQKFGIPAFDLGNPMMDGLETSWTPQDQKDVRLTLIPGSRPPEAYQNWALILQGLDSLLKSIDHQTIGAVAAITPSLDITEFENLLRQYQWQTTADGWVKQNCTLNLWVERYNDCLAYGQMAIAMAGTATEQFVGLGKPAIIMPGAGPQFTKLFAERQTRLLGASVLLLENPRMLGKVVQELLGNGLDDRDNDRLLRIRENGLLRMGRSGAAQKIAACLVNLWSEVN